MWLRYDYPYMDNSSYESDLLGFVVAELRDRVGEWQRIAEASHVPYSTICKIGQGETANPRIGSVQKLANHLLATKDETPARPQRRASDKRTDEAAV